MNYTEFKLEVMELGDFKVNKSYHGVLVGTTEEGHDRTMVYIDMSRKCVINTQFTMFENLDSWTQERLFKLGMEFAETPPEERYEEDLYYAHFLDSHLVYGSESYLVLKKDTNTYTLGYKDLAYGFRTQFTLDQLKKARLTLGLSSDEFSYRLEKVKDVEGD